jgi:uncharacterized membrane protein YkoI
VKTSSPALAKPKKEESAVKYHSSIRAPKYQQKPGQLQKLAKITEKEAVAAASARAGSSNYIKVELESENGNVVYVVEFKNGKQERKIIVDAGTGKILAAQLDRATDLSGGPGFRGR